MRRIILASESPRRKELLNQLIGDNFEVYVSSYEETPIPEISPESLLIRHSLEKARDVAKYFESGIIIAADTSVICNGEVLGKPHTPERAKEMLEKLSGKTVQVITGLTVLDIDRGEEISESEVTDVRMKKMSEKEIEAYIGTGEPLDKAGAFGIQDKGAVLVERVEGDFFNVVGLPLFKLGKILERLGVSVFGEE
ncbi:Septum formation protein Maf [Methanosarcina sp. MTP4]|uniref:Maf family nucleotide pyrophosphatase n=1 Tax=Methanosarcina sp. MTP4 TaxID=1434100 RepID=UPI0006161F52|nr:Maf family nucleotide pyrophosphatase [Methanosarcina sp. MTP4]AKB26152.1 Septum formation protein Maf [Methanosarcina sp. MTP4]